MNTWISIKVLPFSFLFLLSYIFVTTIPHVLTNLLIPDIFRGHRKHLIKIQKAKSQKAQQQRIHLQHHTTMQRGRSGYRSPAPRSPRPGSSMDMTQNRRQPMVPSSGSNRMPYRGPRMQSPAPPRPSQRSASAPPMRSAPARGGFDPHGRGRTPMTRPFDRPQMARNPSRDIGPYGRGSQSRGGPGNYQRSPSRDFRNLGTAGSATRQADDRRGMMPRTPSRDVGGYPGGGGRPRGRQMDRSPFRTMDRVMDPAMMSRRGASPTRAGLQQRGRSPAWTPAPRSPFGAPPPRISSTRQMSLSMPSIRNPSAVANRQPPGSMQNPRYAAMSRHGSPAAQSPAMRPGLGNCVSQRILRLPTHPVCESSCHADWKPASNYCTRCTKQLCDVQNASVHRPWSIQCSFQQTRRLLRHAGHAGGSAIQYNQGSSGCLASFSPTKKRS